MNKLDYAKLAKLAQLNAFDQDAYIKQEFKLDKYQLSFHDVEGTEFVALVIRNAAYISFRNTELSSADVVPHAVRCSKDTVAMGKVHKGYLAKFNQVVPLLNRTIRSRRIERVVFIGHSLGGALAQIAYLNLRTRHKNKKMKCITFGSCKPFKKLPDKEFDKKYVKNYYLLKDYVGMFPFGYKVITEPIILNSDKKYSKDTLPFWGLGKALSSIFITKRHSIDNYIKEINGMKV